MPDGWRRGGTSPGEAGLHGTEREGLWPGVRESLGETGHDEREIGEEHKRGLSGLE